MVFTTLWLHHGPHYHLCFVIRICLFLTLDASYVLLCDSFLLIGIIEMAVCYYEYYL